MWKSRKSSFGNTCGRLLCVCFATTSLTRLRTTSRIEQERSNFTGIQEGESVVVSPAAIMRDTPRRPVSSDRV